MRMESGTQHGAGGGDAMASALGLTVTEHGPARVLSASGEIDTLTAPTLRTALLAGVGDVELVVVDLSDVEFLGSSGLAVLVEARDHVQRNGHRLRLVCGSRIVLRALEATGLSSLFEIADDVPAALRD